MHKYICVAMILLMCMFPYAQDHTTDLLPESTMLYWELDNGKTFCEQMREIGVWQLFASEEWRAFFATIPPEILDLIGGQQEQLQQQFGLSVQDVLGAVSGHMSFAVVDIAMQPAPMPIAVLTWDMGSQKDKVSSLLGNFLSMAVPPEALENYEYNGYSITTIPAPQLSIHFTYVGSRLVVCTDKNYLEQYLTGRSEYSLANNSSYQSVKEHSLRNRSGVLLYANVQRIVDFVVSMEGEDSRQILDMIGLNSIQSLGLGMYFNNGQIVENMYVHMPGEKTGFLGKLLPTGPVSTELERFIPGDLIGFRHGFIDLNGLINTALEALQMFAPREYKQFSKMEKGFNSQLGVNLREQLIGNLGTEYLYSMSFSGGLIPDIAFQITLKDEEAVKNALAALFTMVPEKHRYSFLWNGYTFNYFNYSTMNNPVPVAPTFIIADGRLFITLYPEMAKNLIVQQNGQFPEEATTYLDNRKHLDMEYLNIEKLIVPLYRTAVPFVQALVPRSEVPIEFGLLPAANTLEKYLNNVVYLAFSDEQGLSLESHSPFGLVPFFTGFGLAGYFTANNKSMEKTPIPHVSEKEPIYDGSESNDNSDSVIEGELPANVLALEEERTLKIDDPNFQAQLQNVWLSDSSIKLRTYAAFPKNAIGYGNFQIESASDNLGNSLSYQPGYGLEDGGFAKLSDYEVEDLVRNKGYFFDIKLSAPSRGAESISLKGSFDVKMASFKSLAVENYGKLRGEQVEVTEIDGMVIRFTEDSDATSINLIVKGEMLRIKSISAKDGDSVIETNGWSSYPMEDNQTNISYWFSGSIPDTASIVFEYADQLQTQKVIIDVVNQKLP